MSMNQVVYSYVVREEIYSEGDVIIQEGSQTDWVCVILEGTIKMKKKTPRGQVAMGTLKTGAILGEMTFLAPDNAGRSVSAVAADKRVRLGILDSQRLRREYESVPPRIKEVLQALIKRLRVANEKVCDIVIHSK